MEPTATHGTTAGEQCSRARAPSTYREDAAPTTSSSPATGPRHASSSTHAARSNQPSVSAESIDEGQGEAEDDSGKS